MTKDLGTTRRDMLVSAPLAGLVAVAGFSPAESAVTAQATPIEALFTEWKALWARPISENCPDALLDEHCEALTALQRRIFGIPPASPRDLYIKFHMAEVQGAFDGWDADLLAAEARQALGTDAVTD